MFHYDNYPNTKQAFDDFFGFVTNPVAPYSTPHFVGEFSTGPGGYNPTDKYWIYLTRYIKERSLNWAYWSYAPEPAMLGSYNQGSNSSGIVDNTLMKIVSPDQLYDIQQIMAPFDYNHTVYVEP